MCVSLPFVQWQFGAQCLVRGHFRGPGGRLQHIVALRCISSERFPHTSTTETDSKEAHVIRFGYLLLYFHDRTFPFLKVHICLKLIKAPRRCRLHFHIHALGGQQIKRLYAYVHESGRIL